MNKPVTLTEEQQRTIRSMNAYWQEIATRPEHDRMVLNEIHQLFATLKPMQILLIVGDYAKNYQKTNV